MENNSIHYISWDNINILMSQLSTNIEKQIQPDIIIAIVRGGMVPAAMISHKLGIRNVECIIVRETFDDQINSPKHTPIIELSEEIKAKCVGKSILIVDDIVGSGKTLELVKNQLATVFPTKIMTAVCYVNQLNWEKNNTSNIYDSIDFIGKVVRGWVVFPWENF